MSSFQGNFRFAYFSDQYDTTCAFYKEALGLVIAHSWDRSKNDKGTLFKIGLGLIEILKSPEDGGHHVEGLDYRKPQGVFMVVHVTAIDELYQLYKSKDIPYKQDIVNQDWGHRSFSIIDPNDVVLLFIQDQF